ncbi:MAG TPA: endolytic transglycosylase MltG [Polyangiaceae bacterium]|nr:endolytic transglycosylase MltG [Polyangiaceae bacterium]
MTRTPRNRQRRGSKQPRWARRLWASAGLGLLGLLVLGAALWSWSRRSGPLAKPIEVHIEAGLDIEELCHALASAGVVDRPRWFSLYLRLTRASKAVVPGVHLLRPGLAPSALLARLTRSRARPSVKLTIPEGFNQFQIAERVLDREIAPRSAFLAVSRDRQLLGELGIPGASAEGYLFPATYDLHLDSDPELVLRTLVRETFKRFDAMAARHAERVRARQSESGWGMAEFLTLASIVEKEAGAPEEDGKIASVFYNRLRDETFRPRQMLQSDPTAGYGCLLEPERAETCRGYAGIVTPAMLRDAANRYNTYKHPGLPPGPISNPSESALEAVLDPPETPYFFFVAGPAKRHVFSRTYSEHERVITRKGPSDSLESSARDAASD